MPAGAMWRTRRLNNASQSGRHVFPGQQTEHYTVTRNFLLRTGQVRDILLDRQPDYR
jgi:hypothetical protein